jgi:Holliday junction DNA helicase RuvA
MFASLEGYVISNQPPNIVINVGGVGYEVTLPIPDCANLVVDRNKIIIIYTHLIVREDAHLLYGFLQENNRNCFRELMRVSGIGPKIGLALLSTLSVNQLYTAIQDGDQATLIRTPGVGNKMAARMILELKDRLSGTVSNANISAANNIRNDIANALLSLGYNEKEVNRIVKQLPLDITDISSGIKEALRLLNSN